jgi:phosphopantothenoylcysteine synthetase/decarboxylase
VKLLLTAGNTQAPIDRVRCLTNIFTGRTGTEIALHAVERGHTVTLLTSHPEVVGSVRPQSPQHRELMSVIPYRTFDDLRDQMSQGIRAGLPDAVIHTAAVSDYLTAGIYAPAADTQFHAEVETWRSPVDGVPQLVDVSAGKVKSDAPELWLRLVRAPKLVDLVRPAWDYHGILVKFKLEVGISEDELRAIAERSRRHSAADLMVANTLEGRKDWALLGPVTGHYRHVCRGELPGLLIDAIERLHREKRHG